MSRRVITAIELVYLRPKDEPEDCTFYGLEVTTDDGAFDVWEAPGDWGDDYHRAGDWFVAEGSSWDTYPEPLSQWAELPEVLAAIIRREEQV